MTEQIIEEFKQLNTEIGDRELGRILAKKYGSHPRHIIRIVVAANVARNRSCKRCKKLFQVTTGETLSYCPKCKTGHMRVKKPKTSDGEYFSWKELSNHIMIVR